MRAGSSQDGSTRGGENLFANSIVALDLKTGAYKWHFQSIHHDIWDMDNVMAPVLVDARIRGRERKLVVYGSKSGMYYILDRRDGSAPLGIDEVPVPQEPRQKTSADAAVPAPGRLDGELRRRSAARAPRYPAIRIARCPTTSAAACTPRTGTCRSCRSPAMAAAPTGTTSRSARAPA